MTTFPPFDQIKQLYAWGCLTDPSGSTENGPAWYLQMGSITADQFKELTGKDYVAPKTA